MADKRCSCSKEIVTAAGKNDLGRALASAGDQLSKATFIVPIVKKELLSQWHEYWEEKDPSARARASNKDASLGQTHTVRARNKQEAAKIAESERPGFVAIQSAITRLR